MIQVRLNVTSSRTANSYRHYREVQYHSMKSLALLHSEDGDTTLLRNLGNYQSTWRNIREDLNLPHNYSRNFTPRMRDFYARIK
jgi:hypothetical protein